MSVTSGVFVSREKQFEENGVMWELQREMRHCDVYAYQYTVLEDYNEETHLLRPKQHIAEQQKRV